MKIPNSNGLTETDAVQTDYFTHKKWVDDSKYAILFFVDIITFANGYKSTLMACRRVSCSVCCRQYHHLRSSLPAFGSNQIRKSPFDVPGPSDDILRHDARLQSPPQHPSSALHTPRSVDVPRDVRPSAATRRRDRRAARKARMKKREPPPLNDSIFRLVDRMPGWEFAWPQPVAGAGRARSGNCSASCKRPSPDTKWGGR